MASWVLSLDAQFVVSFPSFFFTRHGTNFPTKKKQLDPCTVVFTPKDPSHLDKLQFVIPLLQRDQCQSLHAAVVLEISLEVTGLPARTRCVLLMPIFSLEPQECVPCLSVMPLPLLFMTA